MNLLRMLANLGYGTRRQVQTLFDEGVVTDLEGHAVGAGARVDPESAAARIRVRGEPLDPPQGMVLMLHKPVGCTCSHDDVGPLVYALLPPRFRARRPVLSTIGRLDRDTSGLLLLTDDGALLHRVSSPRRHVSKTYVAMLAEDLRGDERELFASGGMVLKGEPAPLQPALLEVEAPRRVRLTLHEGRYHQVRRMFAATGNHVLALHRERIGALQLGTLEPGQWRLLGADELARVFEAPVDVAGAAPQARAPDAAGRKRMR